MEIGSPATNILEEAEREGSDLIVMSTHGRTGLAHMLMGSVTEQVVRAVRYSRFIRRSRERRNRDGVLSLDPVSLQRSTGAHGRELKKTD